MDNESRYCTISTGQHDEYTVHAVVRIPEGRNFRADWLEFWNMTHPQATDLEPLPPLPDKNLKKIDRPAWKRLARDYDRAKNRNRLRRGIAMGGAFCVLADKLHFQEADFAAMVESLDKHDWSRFDDPDLMKRHSIARNIAEDLLVSLFLAWLKTLGYEELPYFDARIDNYEDMTTEHMDAVSGRPEST